MVKYGFRRTFISDDTQRQTSSPFRNTSADTGGRNNPC